jgi:hypothetical protein
VLAIPRRIYLDLTFNSVAARFTKNAFLARTLKITSGKQQGILFNKLQWFVNKLPKNAKTPTKSLLKGFYVP